jgi:hypothetical protein
VKEEFMNVRRLQAGVLGMAVVVSTVAVYGLINPHFTPVQLVKQSALILAVELQPGATKDLYTATIREVLKGKTDLKSLRLDLTRAINPQNAEALRQLAGAGKSALFFVGEFDEGSAAPSGRAPERRGLLYLAGQWAEFHGDQDGVWTDPVRAARDDDACGPRLPAGVWRTRPGVPFPSGAAESGQTDALCPAPIYVILRPGLA